MCDTRRIRRTCFTNNASQIYYNNLIDCSINGSPGLDRTNLPLDCSLPRCFLNLPACKASFGSFHKTEIYLLSAVPSQALHNFQHESSIVYKTSLDLSLSLSPFFIKYHGIGIIAIARKAKRLFPQPKPRDSYIRGPARGKNAAVTDRSTV
jgi:hypothetical protein